MNAVALVILLPWAAVIVSSILWRRHFGLPILTGRPKDAIFYSGGASATSNGNMFVALLPSRNLLTVAVTPDELITAIAFPVNLMFLGQLTDLEHRVPRGSVRARQSAGFLSESAVAEFVGADGQPRTIRFDFNTPANFVRAIELGLS